LAFLACRVLALYILYQALPNIIYFGVALPQLTQSDPGVSWELMNFTYVAFYLITILFFWFGASWLSNRMTPAQDASPTEKPLILDGLSDVIIPTVGLVFVIGAVAQLAGSTAVYFSEARLSSLPDSIEGATKLTFGMILIIGGKHIAALIKRART